MDTRMAKYDTEEEKVSTPSRVKRHESLYSEINNAEIENIPVKSNATIIGRQEREIDVEQIKKILDTKYKDAPRKSIRIEEEKEETTAEVPTKEYDLNVFLEKAKDEKEESYEEVRSKKLRDTQFDILKNLNINDDDEEDSGPKPEDNDLLNLINTITLNESKEKASEDNDNNVEVLDEKNTSEDIFAEVTQSLTKTQFEDLESNTNSIEEIKDEIAKVEETSPVINNKTGAIDNSFYTSSNLFTKKDFKKDNDDDDDEKLNLWLKILLVLVFVGILVGLFFFLKSIINF